MVRTLILCGWLPQLPHLMLISAAEATQDKENVKQEAAERAEQRQKKKAIMQQKAAQREQAGSKNGRKGRFLMSGFRSALHMVLTIGSNYQN